MKKISVLFYFTEENVTDSCQEIVSRADFWMAQGLDVCFLVPSKTCELALLLQSKNWKVEYLKTPEFLSQQKNINIFEKIKFLFWDLVLTIQYTRKLIRFAGMFDFDLVHTHGFFAHMMSVALRVRLNTKLLWQAWNLPRENYRMVLFLGSIFSDKVIFKSDSYPDVLKKKFEELGFFEQKSDQENSDAKKAA